MIWRYQDRWFSISLGTLKGFTYEVEGEDKERDVTGVRKRFLALLMTLQEAGRGGVLTKDATKYLAKQDVDDNVVDDDEDQRRRSRYQPAEKKRKTPSLRKTKRIWMG